METSPLHYEPNDPFATELPPAGEVRGLTAETDLVRTRLRARIHARRASDHFIASRQPSSPASTSTTSARGCADPSCWGSNRDYIILLELVRRRRNPEYRRRCQPDWSS